MKYSIILIGLMMLSSCKDETNYILRIQITNLIDKELLVEVFPKSQYINGDNYRISSYDDYSEMKYTFKSNESKSLFESTKLDYLPQELLAEIFDSLTITINLDTVLIIKFKPDYVENYKINMFSDNSIWSYNILEGHERTSFSKNPFVIYDYKFEMKEDNLGN